MTHDLVLLVADLDIEQALLGLLDRPQSIGMRQVAPRCLRAPGRDPECLVRGAELLRPFACSYRHALIIFDRAFGEPPYRERTELVGMVDQALRHSWNDRARCIVIDPEIEVWLWSDSPHVAKVLEWPGGTAELRRWLEDRALWSPAERKPSDPKAAYEAVQDHVRRSHSASRFRKLAAEVSLRRCEDEAFRDLVDVLRGWFPRE